MRFRRPNTSGAFTLVELMVGATLSAAVMAAVLSSYIYLGRGLARLGNQQILETQARRTLAYFAYDVQSATGLTIASVSAPDFSVTFSQPTSPSGVTKVTYYYSQTGTSASIAGNTVMIPAHSLVRVPNTGTALVGPPQTVLSNITETTDGCFVRYYDVAGSSYDNDTAPYTPITNYSLGIKQVALNFRTQLGSSASGNQTVAYTWATGRLVFRNRSFLP